MRNFNRPPIATTELEQMRYLLDQFVSDGQDPPDKVREKRTPKIREILAHDGLRGHYGHAAMNETLGLSHVDIWRRADALLGWINKWLR